MYDFIIRTLLKIRIKNGVRKLFFAGILQKH